ncbi:hypothetical protein PMAYCL1PPCAC_24862 [Pristionchus mayeri]|uniref:Uncharacterized protein n=1 Tax=Pristionchus mayeri TaxID=1317129 RepID=A0AAN5D2R6_9BILA|nr:hypothetical protein PMAYCL1PPCAC_05312 [Pristionchus mayeri]GMR37397.1 hypothetical protein PMAYCL1PPCAC_07592 [Pristionchus mayeri]GMR37421.1 hypothetical protein PMAYCL1PPCAC_07616 [Pristionchus mayeri]GMR37428.1 hypothetical protein PMAYCL1PPCAC_07623 [Pristionchus mayeri]GMR37937.1 hypothetical protein PMAYCL1PPCAC_08132 [Pristionchus mayeri]
MFFFLARSAVVWKKEIVSEGLLVTSSRVSIRRMESCGGRASPSARLGVTSTRKHQRPALKICDIEDSPISRPRIPSLSPLM